MSSMTIPSISFAALKLYSALRDFHLRLNLGRFAEPGVAVGVPGVEGRESVVGEGDGLAKLTPDSVDDADGSVGRFLNTRGSFAPSEGFDTGAGGIGAAACGEVGEGATTFTPGTDALGVTASLGVSDSNPEGVVSRDGVNGGD